MARCSLLLLGVMALATTGCLVSDTPEFKEPLRTPPFLTNLKPSPEAVQTIPVRPGTRPEDLNYTPARISFDVRSEDRGEPVEVLVVLDFKGINSPTLGRKLYGEVIPAGTMQQEMPREVVAEFTLTNDVQPDCHTISVIASHRFQGASAKPATPGDIAIATWFYQVGIKESVSDPMWQPCEPDPRPIDAGSDAPNDGELL